MGHPAQLPLLSATLHLLADGATADELRLRFVAAGARLEVTHCERLLDDLLAHGLARVARTVDGVRYVVPTSLGLKARRRDIAGESSVDLGELETLRSELLSTIAHELRTPLTAIRTSAGLLADSQSPPNEDQRRTLVATIVRNADRMQRLVGDILDLARFRSGSIRLQLRRFDACSLAREVIGLVAPLAHARDQRLVLEACPEGLAVYGDHRRLEQALLNLVSNAQRFSPDGADIVVALDTRGELVRWTVADHGPGIPTVDRDRLFERFFVGRSDVSAAREGVGLGLPTALAIAQAHGGTIDVESEVGRGSAFTLAVPIDGPAGAE